MQHRRIVITGLGVVSPNALGVSAYTAALRDGVSGIRVIAEFDTSMLKTHAAAIVAGFNPSDHMDERDIRRVPRMVPFALAAAREALVMAALPFAELGATGEGRHLELSRRTGIALGTGGGGLHFVETNYRKYFQNLGGYSPFTITAGTHGNLSSELSIALGLRGASHVISTGCTSSTDALGYALLHLRAGTHDIFLAGGADSPITEGILKGFELMRILAATTDPPGRMSRPFSLDRDGFVLGEGAWMFVLEERDHALARGATILAELLGHASTCDAFHRVQPAPDATESVRAIQLALADAGVTTDDIDYVNLHGTSTQMNDALETLAMHKVFGPRAPSVPMSTTKSMIGHPQGACGAAGLAAGILSIRAGFLHPTINLEKPDPACDLDYIPNAARPVDARRQHTILCNCIAFGSKNSAMVVRTAAQVPSRRAAESALIS